MSWSDPPGRKILSLAPLSIVGLCATRASLVDRATVPRFLISEKKKYAHHLDERGDERRREDGAETEAEESPCSAGKNFCARAVNPAG